MNFYSIKGKRQSGNNGKGNTTTRAVGFSIRNTNTRIQANKPLPQQYKTPQKLVGLYKHCTKHIRELEADKVARNKWRLDGDRV